MTDMDTSTLERDALLAALRDQASAADDHVPGTALPPPIESPDALEKPFAQPPEASLASHGEAGDSARAPLEVGDFAGAALIESEARAQGSAQALARGLVVASELWALSGDWARAITCARDAFQAAPKLSIASLQLRALGCATGVAEDLATTLESEARLAASESARVHAALLLSDVLRFGERDAARASRAAELAHRLAPSDVRALVARVVERLVAGETPALAQLPKDSPLRASAQRVAELRGGREAAEPTPALLLNRVRGRLQAGDLTAAGRALITAAESGVAQAPLLDAAAALLAHGPSGRQQAIHALQKRVLAQPTRAAIRTLAARAVEQGDAAALSQALEAADPASGTFDLAERVVLSLLLGGELDLAELDLEVLADQSHPAFAAAFAPSAAAPASGTDQSLDAIVGSALVSPLRREELPLALERLADGDPLRAVLEGELGLATGNAQQTVLALGKLARTLDEPTLLAAAALIHEGQGHVDSAADAYGQAFDAEPGSLWLARALAHTSRGTELAQVLATRARATNVPQRALFSLLAAALASSGDERDMYLERAREADPTEPLVPRLGSLLSARSGDAERRIFWLGALRDASLGPGERALTTLREAMALAERDAATAGALVSELCERYKGDLPLAEYAEQLTGSDAAERATHRLAWEPQTNEEAAWLLSEALWLASEAGDAKLAAQSARALADKTGSALAIAAAELLERDAGELTRLTEPLLAATRDTEHPERQRFAFEKLAELDEARGDASSALLWQRAMLEVAPGHLPALRRLEHELLGAGRENEWRELAETIAGRLHGADGAAYALFLGAEQLATGDYRSARKFFGPLAERSDAPLLALRSMQTFARADQDLALRETIERSLAERSDQPADAAAGLLRAAEAVGHAGKMAAAGALVQQALAQRPSDLVALWLSAELAARDPDTARAAAIHERLAEALGVSAHRTSAWLEAGRLRLRAGDGERAAAAFSNALAETPADEDAFRELRELREAEGDAAALAELLEARLVHARSSRERIDLERARSAAYETIGDTGRRREALESLLELTPEADDVLSAHAEVCTELEDFDAARSSWEKLLVSSKDGTLRLRAESSLGALLQDHLGDLRGAASAYESVLRQTPEDLEIGARLVRAYAKLGDAERSTLLQTRMIQLAQSPEEKRDGALLLAQLYDHVARDPKRAAATLDRTRKAWPLDPAVLAATARFMDRQGDRGARRILVDRTGKDAWRKLEEGRIDPALLELLATVAELQGREDQAQVTRAARSAFLGEPASVEGGQIAALDARLDELLAPSGMSGPLRSLLRKTGPALDAAFPVDLRGINAKPLAAGELAAHITELSRRAGLGAVEVFVAQALGARCLPVSTATPSAPQRLVVGPDLESLETEARDFLLFRALKLQQAGVGAFARSRAEDTWPMLAALLNLFAPNWRPGDVDVQKAGLARKQIERGFGATGYDDDVPVLVLEAIGGAGGQLSHLGEAGRLLANRAALLAVGTPDAALAAFSALSDKPLAESGPSRWRWIGAHVEARELLLFSATDAYADARSRLGIAGVPVHVSEPPRPSSPGVSRAPQPSLPGVPPPRPPMPTLSGEAPPPPRRGAPPPPKRS